MKMKPRSSLIDKVVIVTGASSGIGESTAREFAAAGACTVLAARRIERLERLAKEIISAGGVALPIQTDLIDPDQITHLVETTLSTFGRIDVLANIAGWGRYDWLEELSTEELRNQYDVNIIGLAELIRQVLPTMKSQRSGHILNMSSYASRLAVPPLTVYASTKAAVEALTDGLRRELFPWGITVIRIHPSSVSGTEFKQKAVRQGGIQYTSIPIGQISRERLAHEIVQLVGNPRRALYISRLYDGPILLNQVFPQLVDWLSVMWVRMKRRGELPRAGEEKTVYYQHSTSSLYAVGGLLAFTLIVLKFFSKRFNKP